jgi:hypothetical protein
MEAISNGLKVDVFTSCCSEVFCQFSSTCFGVSRHLLNKIPGISCRQHSGSANRLLLLFSGSTVLIRTRASSHVRFLELFRHMVGLLGRVISPSQGLFLHRTTQHRKTRDKHPCLERDSNPRSQQPTGQDPRIRPHGHCDRQSLIMFDLIRCLNFLITHWTVANDKLRRFPTLR